MNEPTATIEVAPLLSEGRLTLAFGRTVAWGESGDPAGRPLVRLHGMPGCRIPVQPDPSVWVERGLRIITPERPGYGASDRCPGRGWWDPVDDIVAILDALGIDAVPVVGGSGATPYVLGLAARYPARVLAVSVVAGTAPLGDDELDDLIETNATAMRLARSGETGALRRHLEAERERQLAAAAADTTGASDGPASSDAAIAGDLAWQRARAASLAEALRPGVGGWLDDVLVDAAPWTGLEFDRVRTSLTWWHGEADRHCPLRAAARLVERVPDARLLVWPDTGHLGATPHEGAILDELVGRASAAAWRASDAASREARA